MLCCGRRLQSFKVDSAGVVGHNMLAVVTVKQCGLTTHSAVWNVAVHERCPGNWTIMAAVRRVAPDLRTRVRVQRREVVARDFFLFFFFFLIFWSPQETEGARESGTLVSRAIPVPAKDLMQSGLIRRSA